VKRHRIKLLDKFAIRIFCQFDKKTRRLEYLLGKIRGEISELDLNDIELALLNSRRLLLNPSGKIRTTVSLREEVMIYYRILQIPGLLRWLLNDSQIQTTKNFYQLSRIKILRFCAKNFTSLRESILFKVSISFDNLTNYEVIRATRFMNPYSHYDIDRVKTYSIELSHSSKYMNKPSNSKNVNALTKIFIWNSTYAKFISESAMKAQDSFIDSSIQEKYPNFANFNSKSKIVNVIFHTKSNLSFDERLHEDVPNVIDSIDNIEIINQFFIIKDSQWLVIDETCNPKQRFVSGQWVFFKNLKRRNSVILSLPETPKLHYFQEAVFLMGRNDENWYHFLLDTLPRYIFLNKLNKSIPLLIRNDLPNTTIEFISKITSRLIVQIDQDDVVKVKKLYFLAARSTSFDTKSKLGYSRFQFSPNIIRELKSFILAQIAENNENIPQNKLYLIQNSAKRNLLNINNVTNLLDKYGFYELKLNDDYYKNQISYFANANILVAKGGAACANMIFLKPQSHIVILRGFRERNIKIWKLLAESSQVQLSEIFGLSIYFGIKENRAIHSNFIIPVYKLKDTLRKLLNYHGAKKNF